VNVYIFIDGRLCNNDLQALKTWHPYPYLNQTLANELTRQGEQDMRLLARRLQSDFPDLLRTDPQNINHQIYKVALIILSYLF
jgi:hypothetical protein